MPGIRGGEQTFVGYEEMLLGENETEPNSEKILQLALEACKEDLLELLVQKLHILGWEVSFLESSSFFQRL